MLGASVVERGLQDSPQASGGGWLLVSAVRRHPGAPGLLRDIGQPMAANQLIERADPRDVVGFHAAGPRQIGLQAVADGQPPQSPRRSIKDITADVRFVRGPNCFRVCSRTRACAEFSDSDGFRAGADATARMPALAALPIV
jgi:hypothetical protein